MARAPQHVAIAISVALVGATLSPLLRRPVDDGFPLSTYPMFAFHRDTHQLLDYPVGETATGQRRTLAPYLIGTGEVLQALVAVSHAVAHKTELGPLCERIARAVAADDDFADVAVVRIVTGEHDAVRYFVDGDPGTETVVARCRVMR